MSHLIQSHVVSRCSFAMFLLMVTATPNAFAGLIGHWTFDEGTGLVAADSSGNGRTGTLLAAPSGSTPTWTNDGTSSGSALSFDGTGYVNMTNTASDFNFGAGGFTVAAWARYNTLTPFGSDSSIVSKHNGGTANGYMLTARSTGSTFGNAWFYSNGNNTTGVVSPNTYDDNQWHFLVGTNDGVTGRLYVDGKYIGSEPGTPVANSRNMLVGGVFMNNGSFVDSFVGSIDDVRVYDNALTQSEISQLYFDDVIRDSVTRQVVTESSRNWEVGTFTPKFGRTLDEAKAMGGYDHFNWYQVIREDTHLIHCIGDNTTCKDSDKNASGTILSLPYEDPPLGGYFNSPDDNLHGYYQSSDFAWPAKGALPAVTTPTSFSIIDGPCIHTPADTLLFSTYLGGVDTFGNLIVFAGGNTSFRWRYTQTGAIDCNDTISHLKVLPSDGIGPNEGIFDQLEFITEDNIGADELAFLASEGVRVQFIDPSSQPVPEPFTLPLLGAALTAQMLIRLRKKRAFGEGAQDEVL